MILGGFLGTFLKSQLKGTPRADLEDLAFAIRAEAKSALGKDEAYVKEITEAYHTMRTPAQKDALIRKFEAALTKNDFGKKLVERICKTKFPEKFVAAKPAAPAKPTTVKINVNGTPQDAYVFAKRPDNLIRDVVTFKGREYHTGDLTQMQMMSRGFVKSKTGTPVLVTWKAKV